MGRKPKRRRPCLQDCPGCGYPLKVEEDGAVVCDCPLYFFLNTPPMRAKDDSSFAGARTHMHTLDFTEPNTIRLPWPEPDEDPE